MSRQSRVLIRMCLLTVTTCLATGYPVSGRQANASPTISAIRAKLIKPLDALSLRGQSFYVNTMTAWQQGNCTVPVNTIIQGQIKNWQRQKEGAKQEVLSVRFEPIPCHGNETLKVTPVLVALRGPLKRLDDAGLGAAEREDAMRGAMANRPVQGAGGAAGRAEQSEQDQGLAGVPGSGEVPDTSAFETGEVRNFHGVRMVLPVSGPDAATTLVSAHSIVLPTDTQFFLAFVSSSMPLVKQTR
jgi:hypothetical protein